MAGLSWIDLGGVRIALVSGGRFRLDGGAMFGIIPKPLWSRHAEADADNHIALACNCVLVEWPGGSARRALIETGHGEKYRDKERGFFAIDRSRWLLPALVEAGVDPATITDVVLSHMHFDHAGGLTRQLDEGVAPTFPNARVHAQVREFGDARANFGIMTNTYREENFAAIDEINAWRMLDGEERILPNLRSILTPGHTRGHHSIVIEGSQRTAVFSGDVMPTRHHVGRPYNMAYDLLPLDNRESKSRLLAEAADREWLIVLDHDPQHPLVRAKREKDWFVLQPESV